MERQVHFQSSDLKTDLPFVNVLCVQTSTQQSAGPLAARTNSASSNAIAALVSSSRPRRVEPDRVSRLRIIARKLISALTPPEATPQGKGSGLAAKAVGTPGKGSGVTE